MIQTTRKCKDCKELIILEEGNFVEKNNSYRHYDCYVNFLMTTKKKPLNESEAKETANKLKDESVRNANDIIARNHLFKWLQRAYDLVVLPTYFYQKMEDVFNGRYKGLSEPICAEDILYVWQKKKEEFDKLNAYQSGQGKIIEGTNRF